MLSNIRIVLVNTTHPGNIGAAARAMKNMGLSQLYLVAPLQFPHRQALDRAAGADDVLNHAAVVNTLEEALSDCEHVYATSARMRHIPWPVCTPREAATEIIPNLKSSIAIVFGRESSGLTNEELALAQKHINIPTAENFKSLNIAAAVQVITYELKMATLESNPTARAYDELSTSAQLEGFYQHWYDTMTKIHFLDPKQPKMLMQRLRRLFTRARLEKTELNILRGFLAAVDKKLD